jgi:hypothetical protein
LTFIDFFQLSVSFFLLFHSVSRASGLVYTFSSVPETDGVDVDGDGHIDWIVYNDGNTTMLLTRMMGLG